MKRHFVILMLLFSGAVELYCPNYSGIDLGFMFAIPPLEEGQAVKLSTQTQSDGWIYYAMRWHLATEREEQKSIGREYQKGISVDFLGGSSNFQVPRALKSGPVLFVPNPIMGHIIQECSFPPVISESRVESSLSIQIDNCPNGVYVAIDDKLYDVFQNNFNFIGDLSHFKFEVQR